MKILNICIGSGFLTIDRLKHLQEASPDLEQYVFDKYSGDVVRFDDPMYIDHVNTAVHQMPQRILFKGIRLLSNQIRLRHYLARQGQMFDVLHVSSVDVLYRLSLGQLKKHCGRLVLSVFGSDFYRSSSFIRNLQRALYERADIITFTNELMAQDFQKSYGDVFTSKFRICRFGLGALVTIKELKKQETKKITKITLGFPLDKIIVCCGFAPLASHQQLAMITSLQKYCAHLRDRIFLLFPMKHLHAMKTEIYIQQVEKAVQQAGFAYKIFRGILSIDDIARLRIASDIMIHTPPTDQFSGTMTEVLYAGNVVVTGAWLPYDVLDQAGIEYFKVKHVAEVGKKLADIVNTPVAYRIDQEKNARIIWEFASWEKNLQNWIELYQIHETDHQTIH